MKFNPSHKKKIIVSVSIRQPLLDQIEKLMDKEGYHIDHEFAEFCRQAIKRGLKLK